MILNFLKRLILFALFLLFTFIMLWITYEFGIKNLITGNTKIFIPLRSKHELDLGKTNIYFNIFISFVQIAFSLSGCTLIPFTRGTSLFTFVKLKKKQRARYENIAEVVFLVSFTLLVLSLLLISIY